MQCPIYLAIVVLYWLQHANNFQWTLTFKLCVLIIQSVFNRIDYYPTVLVGDASEKEVLAECVGLGRISTNVVSFTNCRCLACKGLLKQLCCFVCKGLRSKRPHSIYYT